MFRYDPALENPHGVFETDIDLAREFLAGMVKQILVQPTVASQP
ncbi:MAG TPA: hypothetical protein VMT45_02615 [Thermoanaerobaculaceae bacterium]|nr:hypothetical protein [Thermoanaerobaculaceae bacterium]